MFVIISRAAPIVTTQLVAYMIKDLLLAESVITSQTPKINPPLGTFWRHVVGLFSQLQTIYY